MTVGATPKNGSTVAWKQTVTSRQFRPEDVERDVAPTDGLVTGHLTVQLHANRHTHYGGTDKELTSPEQEFEVFRITQVLRHASFRLQQSVP